MAEAEVSLKYRDLPASVAHVALATALPLMIIFLFWSALCILIALVDGRIRPGPTYLLMFGELSVCALTVLGLVLCADKTVYVTRDGISLPFIVCPGFGLRIQRSWSDLNGVRFMPNGGRGTLILHFKKGFPARFNFNRLEPKTIEQLIVAIDVWAGGSDSFPALLDARTYAQPNGEGSKELSYTQMWEDELARRFGATNFIPLEPGHQLREGRFTVERQIAFGGFSAIYLLVDASKKHFVLKESVIPQDSDEHLRQKAQEMFEREALLLSKLNNPHLASVLDYFVEAGRHYLLMEYIPGQDLRRLVKEFGPQSQDKVLNWSRQLATILSYLHTQHPPIIHRDISPDNLILREDGQLAIIDFGAANQFLGTATGTMIGKQAYIAPEQLRGKAETRSDIYGFGCTVYFLLTGDDPEPLSVSHPSKKNLAVSRQLDELVAQCTAMDAEDRPTSAAVLEERLEAIGR